MNDPQLTEALESVSRRYRRILIGSALAGTWGVAALGGIALRQWLHGLDYQAPLFAAGYAAALGLALTPVAAHWLKKTRDPVWLAHKLEKKFPELDTRLLAAVEQPDKTQAGVGFLQQMVISQAVSHARRTGWDQLVPERRIRMATYANYGMIATCAVVACMVFWEVGRIAVGKPSAPRAAAVAPTDLNFDIKVDAEKEIERGSALLVTATFGNGRLPADVQLLYREPDAEMQELSMSKSALNDPKFAARLVSVKRDMEFSVRYGDQQTEWFPVKVFDYPQLKEADAHLKYPEFTGLPEKDLPNTRIVTAVEGTQATLTFKLNKPVAQATLVPAPRNQRAAAVPGADPTASGTDPQAGRGARGGRGRVGALAAQNGRGPANDFLPDGVASPSLTLVKDPNDPTQYTVKVDLLHSQLYQLQLVDTDKRGNRDKASMTLNVSVDRPSTVRVTAPARDVEVSPIEELTVKGQVSDDFGVKRVGITYTMHGEQKEIVIAENLAAKERRDVTRVIALEDLKAQPDELLSYNLWAEDVGPDGKVRRTQSDMFFAEVRPFEEIYRQGQQPAEGQDQQQQQRQQQQNGQQQTAQRAEDITNQLKQILSAMWTVTRREVNEKVTSEFVPDIQAISEAQSSAHQAAAGLEERITDDRAKAYLDSGMKNLEKAADLLKIAEGPDTAGGPSAKPLPDAIAADQAAYNDFLKLRDRQFEVVRGNRQGQQGNTAQARRQQQLNQLDLQNQQNRYQTQRQAQQQQQEQEQQARQTQQNENRQVLNRVRDLAQRQEDLNRQMREAQAALQEAQNQQQRDEIQRQLARLQEQQQQQLQETDELRERLDEPQNQDNMADARQQLDQARENVQQASQALQQGQAGQAAAAGQRASEQLNNLENQVRQQAAGQFTDTMQQMRQDARQLEQEAQENSQQLAQLDQTARDAGATPQPGLRNTQQQDAQRTRQQVADSVQQQRDQLDRLLQNMQQTVEQAETSEPLLSRQLYDTIRQSQAKPPEKALDTTQQLVRQGFTQQARQTNDEATQGLTRIREGVEQAAASVLGDETQSLRRAQATLDELSQQLDREIGRNQQAQQQLANAQNQARGGRGQNPDGQNPSDERQGANAGNRGAAQDQQAAGRAGNRGQRGAGQQPGDPQSADGQQPGAGRGQRGGTGQPQTDQRQLANGQQPEAGQEGQQPAGRGGQRGQRGGAGGQQPGDEQAADGQQPGRGGQRGQRGGAGGQQPGDEQQAADAQQGEGQQPGAGRGQRGGGQRGGAGGQQPGDQQQLADGQQPGSGQRGGRAQRGGPNGRGGQPGDPQDAQQQGGQPGDPAQADQGQPQDPQLADAQDQQGRGGQAGGQRGGPGLRGGAGLRGGQQQARGGQQGPGGQPGGGGQQNPQDAQDPQGQQIAGGGRNPILNPLQIGGGGEAPSSVDPLTGGGYRDFSDRLRDVQDMVSDPQLRAQAQQIRERASAVRLDVTRHSAPPNWNTVSQTIGKPLAELRDKVSQELLKRDKAQAALVPLDREPVPPEFQEQVKQYYEKLGSGK